MLYLFPGITQLETEVALEANSLPDHVEFQWVDGEGWSKTPYLLLLFLPCPAASVATHGIQVTCVGVLGLLVSSAVDIDVSGNIVG